MDPNAFVLLMQFAGTIVGAGIGAYVAARWSKSGELTAIKKNFQDILEQQKSTTREIEAIKQEVAGGLWEQQARWTAKKEAYVQLLDALDQICVHYRMLHFLATSGGTDLRDGP